MTTTNHGTIHTTLFIPNSLGRIYAAFPNPNELATWWGSDVFSSEFASFGFRVGGMRDL